MLLLEMAAHEVCGCVPHLQFKTTIIAFSKFFIINNKLARVNPNFTTAS